LLFPDACYDGLIPAPAVQFQSLYSCICFQVAAEGRRQKGEGSRRELRS